MTAASAANILIAASEVDDRLLECLADCRATLVRTFEEAQRALREHWFRMIVIDLNFDNVRMFDLLQHVRSLSTFNAVPILCVQGSEPGAGIGAALDRLVRKLGGKGFVDLRGDEVLRLRDLVAIKLGAENPPRRRLCILIIDHDVDAAHRLAEILEQAGHDVDFAYHGDAGVEAARNLRPDVVFVDLALPRSDAYQLARRLRRELGLHDALIIALCAGASEEERRCLEEAGFDHQLGKHPDCESVGEALNARRDKKYKLPKKNVVRP